jgi:hypothetical protein
MIKGGNGYPLSPRRYGGKAFSPPLTKLKMGSTKHVYINMFNKTIMDASK